MTIPSIARLLDYARVQMAAEALYGFDSREQEKPGGKLLDPGDTSFDPTIPIVGVLTEGNGHTSKFTATDAKAFAQEWEVVEHKSNTGSGFSGTLFRRLKDDPVTGGKAGDYVLSIRSTEFIDDAARDCEATNTLEIKEKGWAFGQIDDLENWYKSLKGSGKLPLDAKLNVTGYSLGGHLATAFNLMHNADLMVEGTVEHVSADSADGNTNANPPANDRPQAKGQPLVYKALVTLKRMQLEMDGQHFPLSAGMQSNAEILLGTRTVMEYLLSPVRKAWHEAGRER